MTDFAPIDPTGLTDRELLVAVATGQNKLHGCVESFKADQAKRDKIANDKRHAIANAVTGLQGQVGLMQTELGEVKAGQEIDSGRITKLAQRLGAEKGAEGEKVHVGIGGVSAWKFTLGVLGAMSGLVVFVQIFAPAIVAGSVTLYRTIMAHH